MQLLRFAHGPETLRVGDLEVRRVGFGVSDLTVDDRATAHAVLKRAVELGAHVILTASDPVIDELVTEALSPYPGDLVFAARLGSDVRAAVECELEVLRVTQLQVAIVELDALDAAIELQRDGKIRHLGLAGVDREQLDAALAKTKIALVNSVVDPDLLAVCEQRGIAFIPDTPSTPGADNAAKRLRCTPAQLVIASLLARSPVMLPIATAAKVVQVEEHLGAVHVTLDEQTLHELAA